MLLIVFLLVEFFYAYVLLQVVFFKYSGYTFVQGINQLTAGATGLTQATMIVPPDNLSNGPPVSLATPNATVAAAHMLFLRHFTG